jgi:hypothetical protein
MSVPPSPELGRPVDLYCKVFVHGAAGWRELAELVARGLGGVLEFRDIKGSGLWIYVDGCRPRRFARFARRIHRRCRTPESWRAVSRAGRWLATRIRPRWSTFERSVAERPVSTSTSGRTALCVDTDTDGKDLPAPDTPIITRV